MQRVKYRVPGSRVFINPSWFDTKSYPFPNGNSPVGSKKVSAFRLKTAVLFGASLKIGALIGRAGMEEANNLYDFGLNIGLGFQLKDDLLDTFGDENIFGRQTGGDILTNKKTFLFLHALEVAEEKEQSELMRLYNTAHESAGEKISKVIGIFEKLNIYEATSAEIDRYFTMGMSSLDKISIQPEKKEKLIEVAHKMIDREK